MTEMIALGEVQEFDEDKRELLIQVLPWNKDARTARGYERFEKGAFEGIDPSRFVLRQRHQDPPTGRGMSLEETDTHLLMRAMSRLNFIGQGLKLAFRLALKMGLSPVPRQRMGSRGLHISGSRLMVCWK